MECDDQYGPALPPGLVAASSHVEKDKPTKKYPIGPNLPPGMQKSSDSDDLSDEGPLTVKMDPEVSPEYTVQDEAEDVEDDQDEGIVGPMPSEMSQGGEASAQVTEEFERRSKRMKDELTVKAEAEEGPSKRDQWMTELPPEMGKNFGLQNRTFSKGAGASDDNKDRSSWTETPLKKEKDSTSKSKKRKREEEKGVSARDRQLQQQVDEYNKNKRPESLMDIHAKKQKKKKKKEKKEKKRSKEKGEEEEKPTRRTFDRDLDLQVNRFDDAKRQAIIKKSQLLNTRFSKGGTTSQFL